MLSVKNNMFYIDGTENFLLADTCWSAFTNATLDDWKYYINYRAKQGFNVVQVNLLRQWDASASNLSLEPFELNEDGTYNFKNRNEKYFDRAYEMVKFAKDKGITIALVLLWVNYLPDTWATKMRKTSEFPKDMLLEYVDFVVDKFRDLEPLYFVSGDTDFPTDEVTFDYYNKTLNRLKEISPESVAALHIRGREDAIPNVLRENNNLDFYMYQSGHNKDFQYMAYTLAEKFSKMNPIRPVINSEPCYEMMGYSRRVYGRFSREDVRRVAWQSVFSGAKAGITYGAHGVWSWHTEGLEFDSNIGEAFETPYDWRDALKFEGAWDYGFLRSFVEKEGILFGTPNQTILLNDTEEIRVIKVEERLYLYIPSNIKIKLKGDYFSKNIYYIDLETKNSEKAKFEYLKETDSTSVYMHTFTKDAILIIK